MHHAEKNYFIVILHKNYTENTRDNGGRAVILEINRIDNELLFRRHGNLIYCSAI